MHWLKRGEYLTNSGIILFPCNFTKQAVLQDSDAQSDCFTTKRCETEGLQLQPEDLTVTKESISQEVIPQDYGFHDDDIATVKFAAAMPFVPCKPFVMSYCNTAPLFGSAVGAAYMTQKNSFPTPALASSGAHLRLCGSPVYSPPSPLVGMKYDNSFVDHIPNTIMFGSCASTYSSDKTNAEKQVTHNSPVPQHHKKTKLKAKYRKKMVTGLQDATASEQEFPERPKRLVSLPSGVFYIQDAMNVMLKSKLHSPNETCHKNAFVSRFIAVQQNKSMARLVMKLLSRSLKRKCKKHYFCLFFHYCCLKWNIW